MSTQTEMLRLLYLLIIIVQSQTNTNPSPQPTPEPRFCNETLQCESSSINENNLYCDGFYGCTDSEIEADKITCDGSYACLKSKLSTTSYLYCNGKSACYNSTKAYSYGVVSCQGQYGCAWSQNITSTTMGVNCGGYMSCMHANITASGVKSQF